MKQIIATIVVASALVITACQDESAARQRNAEQVKHQKVIEG